MPEANAAQILDEIRRELPGHKLEYGNPTLRQCWPIRAVAADHVVLVTVLISKHQIPRELLPEERLCISQAERHWHPKQVRYLYVSQKDGQPEFTWDPESTEDTGVWKK